MVSNRLALLESGVQGEDAAQQSMLILSAQVGALMLSRSVGDPDLSDRLLHGARELLIEQANATLNT